MTASHPRPPVEGDFSAAERELLTRLLSNAPLPAAEDETTQFWRSAASGALELTRCTTCERWSFPPAPDCSCCGADTLTWSPVSGRGVLLSFTVNEHRWYPELPATYMLGLVQLDEQANLRLLGPLLGAEEGAVIGRAVAVELWARTDAIAQPVFRQLERPPV